jgi:peptidoglycan hydrolase-like protein with peptidoglycan-binding domain
MSYVLGAVPADPEMEMIQRQLNAAGASPKLATDGRTGPKTVAAIEMFRLSHGLPPAFPPGSIDSNLKFALDTAAPQSTLPAVQLRTSSTVPRTVPDVAFEAHKGVVIPFVGFQPMWVAYSLVGLATLVVLAPQLKKLQAMAGSRARA